MNKYFIYFICFFATIILISLNACKKEEEIIKVDVKFDYSAENNNKPKFWSTSVNPAPSKIDIYYNWTFSNGETHGDSVAYPNFDFPGEYPIQLVIKTSEGVNNYSDTIHYTVHKINPELKENPYLHNLTLGNDTLESKKWVLSSAKGHMSLGYSQGIKKGTGIDYKNDSIIEETIFEENYLTQYGADAYSNTMEFYLNRYVYKNTGSHKWIVNWYFANEEFGYNQAEGKDICIDVSEHLDTVGVFTLKENKDGTVFIELSKLNFLLYYEGKPSNIKYQVLALYNDLMVIRKPYFDKNGDYAGYRMLRYVPEDKKTNPLPTNYKMSAINPPHTY